MKKLICFIVLFYFINLIHLSSFDLGVRMGLNSSSLIGDQVSEKVGTRLGLHYGANVGFDASKSLSIHLGIFHTTRGENRNRTFYKVDDEDVFTDTFNIDYKYHLNFLEIETLFNFTLLESESIYFSGHTGLAILGLLDATETNLNKYYVKYEKDVKNDHMDVLLEIPIGLSLKVKPVSDRLYLGTQYRYGLSSIRKGIDFVDPDIRTEAFILFIRFTLLN